MKPKFCGVGFFFLLWIFFCCAARIHCKIWEVKGSVPSSITAPCSGHTNICNIAFTEVQKCDSQLFYSSLFFLEDYSLESSFSPHLNHCSPTFFLFFEVSWSSCHTQNSPSASAVHMFGHFPFTCLPYTPSLHFTQTLPSCASIQFSAVLCDFPKPSPWAPVPYIIYTSRLPRRCLHDTSLPALLEPEVSHRHGCALTLASAIWAKVLHLSPSLSLSVLFKLDVKFEYFTV